MRDSPYQTANLQLHFGPRKNEGMAEVHNHFNQERHLVTREI